MPINSFENYPMSWKPEKSRLKKPYYLAIAEALSHDIALGILLPNTKLPPQRELADFLDLNFTTITRAYKNCELRGVIYTIRGSGTFVSPNAARTVTISADNYTGNSIDLAFVASFEECNELIASQLPNLLKNRYLPDLLNYNEPTGMRHQKLAGISWMREFGIEATIDTMAIVSGAQNALLITLLALFEPGSKIAVDIYTYPNFIELAKLLHIQLVAIPGDDEGMLAEQLDNQCELQNIKGAFFMPSCANPTTIVISNQRRKDLCAVIKKNNLVVIEDDSYSFLFERREHLENPAFFTRLPETTVYICGTSKSICSGLRVAYIVFPKKIADKIFQAIFNSNVKTSSFTAEIITQLILTGEAGKIVLAKKNLAREANCLFFKYFSLPNEQQAQLSFFRWLPIANYDNIGELENLFLRNGIRVFHSSIFLSSRKSEQQFLRVALSGTSSLLQLEKGLKILQQIVQLR